MNCLRIRNNRDLSDSQSIEFKTIVYVLLLYSRIYPKNILLQNITYTRISLIYRNNCLRINRNSTFFNHCYFLYYLYFINIYITYSI